MTEDSAIRRREKVVTKREMILVGIAVIILLLVYPFKVTVAPEWRVEVTDENGKPLPGAYLSEFATHGTLDFEHEEAMCTSANGEGRFARRTVRASVLTRISRWIVRFNVHGGLGPYVAVGVDRLGYGDMPTQIPEPNFNGLSWYGGPSRVDSRVSLQKCPNEYTGYKCGIRYDDFFATNSSAKQIAACDPSAQRNSKVWQ